MNRLSISAFNEAISVTHGANARLAERVRVDEHFDGQIVWEGEVLIFDLQDHPTASRCYCWELDGIVTAVLEEGPVKSARDAVRASIMADAPPDPEAG